jgi:IS5 family transposase
MSGENSTTTTGDYWKTTDKRTILGVVMREVQRKLDDDRAALAAASAPAHAATNPKALSDLTTLLERAERIRTQQRHTKNKLYALHAPEVECISKGKARNPYEFGVKVSLAVTHKQGLMVGARSFPGNPYDGHILSAQLDQTSNLLQDLGRTPRQAIVDLGYRGVDADNPGVQIIHRGKYKSLSEQEKKLLKRRQAIEPLIGHTKADHRMDRCWLQGALGDALHALSCAAGYNIRWLLRAIARLALGGLICAWSALIASVLSMLLATRAFPKSPASRSSPARVMPPALEHTVPIAVG